MKRWAVAMPAAAAVAIAARRTRALTPGGAIAATAVGTVVLARGGLPAATALIAFFVSGSALSRFKAQRKRRRGVLAQAKGGERDAWQVLANGGVAAAALALLGRQGAAPFLGALAAASADTWATELGLLATRPPRLLTTLRPVAPGTSGAVTPEGTLAAAAGAATVALAWQATRHLQRPGNVPAIAPLAIVAAGTAGALADSLLGATVQATYWCATCREPVETPRHARCGQPTALSAGWPWLTNDAVNLLATAAGALAGTLLNRP